MAKQLKYEINISPHDKFKPKEGREYHSFETHSIVDAIEFAARFPPNIYKMSLSIYPGSTTDDEVEEDAFCRELLDFMQVMTLTQGKKGL